MPVSLKPGSLKLARQSALLTQRELAAMAGTTAATVNRIEQGLQPPQLSTLRRLSQALGVSPGDLIAVDAGVDNPKGT